MNTQQIEPQPPSFYGSRQQQRAAYRASQKFAPESNPSIHPAIKLTRKLASLPLLKVASFARRFARRTSTSSHLLKRLHPGSLLRVPLEASIRGNETAFQQCIAELKARNDHALKLA